MGAGSTLAWSVGGGIAGGIVFGVVYDGMLPGAPNLTMWTLIAVCLGMGVGWAVGSAAAWVHTWRRWSVGDALWLAVAAASIVLFAIVAMIEARTSSFGPAIDGIGRGHPTRQILATVIVVDAVLALATLVLFGLRGSSANRAT